MVILSGCGGFPTAPSGAGIVVSGQVYEAMVSDSGEPPIADVTVTVKDATGAAATTLTDEWGFYTVPASLGPVVVTAEKPGYKSRVSRFELVDSTVLNFALRPVAE